MTLLSTLTRPSHEFLPRDPAQTVPCERCGAPVHPMLPPLRHRAPVFAICLLRDAEECRERVRTAGGNGQDGGTVRPATSLPGAENTAGHHRVSPLLSLSRGGRGRGERGFQGP